MIESLVDLFEYIGDQLFVCWYKQDELAQLKRIHRKIGRYQKRCEDNYTHMGAIARLEKLKQTTIFEKSSFLAGFFANAFSSWILYAIVVTPIYALWRAEKAKLMDRNREILVGLKIQRELLLRKLAKYMKEDEKMKEIMNQMDVNNNN